MNRCLMFECSIESVVPKISLVSARFMAVKMFKGVTAKSTITNLEKKAFEEKRNSIKSRLEKRKEYAEKIKRKSK